MEKDLNLLLKLGDVGTAICIQDESHLVAPFRAGSCEPPNPATLSCPTSIFQTRTDIDSPLVNLRPRVVHCKLVTTNS